MCGRYVSPDEAAIEREWHIGRGNNTPFRTRFNTSPTTRVPLLLAREDGRLDLQLARWGLAPHWWKDSKPPRLTFNARSEEAASKPMWRYPASRARCLVPALGWYEWQEIERVNTATGEIEKIKQPHFIYLANSQPFAFAGLVSEWRPEGQEAQLTCAILTQDAVGPAAEVHTRMPVVLSKDAESDWLDATLTDAKQAIASARERAVTEFEHFAVSTRVNNARNEGAELIEREVAP